MTGGGRAGFRLGRHALGPRHACLVLGFESRGGGVSGFGFLRGAALRFPRRLFFRGHARQGGGFRRLLGAQFLVREIGRAPLGLGALAGEPGKLFLLGGPRRRRDCEFGRGELAALGIRQGALFGFDSRAQRDLGHAFGMSLLRRRCLGGGLRRGAADGMFSCEIVGLLAPLRGRDAFGGQQLPRFGGGAGALFRSGAGQGVGLGGPFGIGRVRGGEIAAGDKFAALTLHLLQSLQQFAQASPRVPDAI